MDENYQYGYQNDPNGSYPPPQQDPYDPYAGQQTAYGQPQSTYIQPQPSYDQPQSVYGQSQDLYGQPQSRNNGKCITSMILGILSIPSIWLILITILAWIPIAMGIVAIVLGSIGSRQISVGPGHKMANAGRILGIISLGLILVIVTIVIIAAIVGASIDILDGWQNWF